MSNMSNVQHDGVSVFMHGCRQYGSVTAGIEAGAVAGVMLYSVGCFGSILTTSGQDVRLLMKGISADKGLSQLFQRLKNVQTGVRSS